MIGLYLQVFAVLALVAGAATALGNEIRLMIDDRHEQAGVDRTGRHHLAAIIATAAMRPFLREHRQRTTVRLFAEADEAIASDEDTVWLVRG